jgi:hypothetical protein
MENSSPWARAVAQPFHHRDHLGHAEAHPAVFGRHRQSQHAEARAGLPPLAAEDLFAVAADDVVVQLRAGEFDGGILQLLLLVGKSQIHKRS